MGRRLALGLVTVLAAVPGCLEEDGSEAPAGGETQVAAAMAYSDAQLSAWGIINVRSRSNPATETDWADEFEGACYEAMRTGKIVWVPSGDYPVKRPIRIVTDGTAGGNSSEQTCVIVGSAHSRPNIILQPNSVTTSAGGPQCVISIRNIKSLKSRSITAVSKANPAVVTYSGEAAANGEVVFIDGVQGMTQLNKRFFKVTGATATTFKLADEITGSGVDSTGYAAYASGGTADTVADQPNASYNHKLVNLTIKVRSGNPWAGGIQLRGAQGSGIQDCTIDLTEDGHTGVVGGCGSGGAHAGVTVRGGRIGMDLSGAQPAPTIASITLIGQSEAALLYSGFQTLTAVGLRIESSAAGPVIRHGTSPSKGNGHLSLVDSTIAFSTFGTANTVVESIRNVYLKNVYVRNGATLLDHPNGGARTLPASATGWVHVVGFARGAADTSVAWDGGTTDANRNLYSYPLWIWKGTLAGRYASTSTAGTDLRSDVAAPAEDFVARHHWGATFVPWENSDIVDVTAHGATADDASDDYAAFASAFAAAAASTPPKTVFVPAGKFLTTRTLQLPKHASLVGVARHLSLIYAKDDSGSFGSALGAPVLQTSAEVGATAKIAFLKLGVQGSAGGKAYALKWQSGGDSVLRCVNFFNNYGSSSTLDQAFPFVLITGAGGGKWYEFFMTTSSNQGSGYRHLKIAGTKSSGQPLAIYQCNPEHVKANGQFLEPQMEIEAASRVSIYGLKSEGNSPVVSVRNSDHVRIFGYGGNASALPGKSLFVVSDTPNWLVANAVEMPRQTGADALVGSEAYDIADWSMIRETVGTQTFETRKEAEPLGADRPVLYQRGEPEGPGSAPTCSITSPASGATVSGTVAVSATAVDDTGVTKVEFRVDGALVATDTSAPYGFSWDTTLVANGTYALYALAYDAGGSVGASAMVSLAVANATGDAASPTCAITSPSNGATVGGRITISASASDDVGVTKVNFRIDGAWVATDTAAPYAFDWDTTGAANGAHSVEARAFDASGKSTLAAISVTVFNDLAPPTCSITSPANGATVSGTVAVSASAGDDVGVTKVEFRVDGALVATDAAAPYGFAWDTLGLANGTHTLEARAYDASGKSAGSGRAVTVSNDTAGPTVSITSPSNGATVGGKSVSISVSASDPSGVARVAFFIDGAWVYTDENAPWSYSWDSRPYRGRTVTIRVNARDAKDNVTSKSITVAVR